MQNAMRGRKWIGHARLLVEVPSTSIEYCEVYKIPRRVGFLQVPWSRVHCFYLLRRNCVGGMANGRTFVVPDRMVGLRVPCTGLVHLQEYSYILSELSLVSSISLW